LVLERDNKNRNNTNRTVPQSSRPEGPHPQELKRKIEEKNNEKPARR
jgi:hypothetical protein